MIKNIGNYKYVTKKCRKKYTRQVYNIPKSFSKRFLRVIKDHKKSIFKLKDFLQNCRETEILDKAPDIDFDLKVKGKLYILKRWNAQ